MDNIIRVFIGAPSDVNPEREIIKKIINNMNIIEEQDFQNLI